MSAERDVMWRLDSFLSKKDREVVENENNLQNNHVQLWVDNNKSLDNFFFDTRSLPDWSDRCVDVHQRHEVPPEVRRGKAYARRRRTMLVHLRIHTDCEGQCDQKGHTPNGQ